MPSNHTSGLPTCADETSAMAATRLAARIRELMSTAKDAKDAKELLD
jgi:hypothetical protein